MNYPSKLIEQAIDEIAKLPGIGKKSALRMALHLLKRDEKHTLKLAEAIVAMRTQIRYCEQCHNISDTEICGICANQKREASLICVVEDARDVLAIENTSQYRGLYHVLGGIISPLEGVGPADLKIESLINRITTSQNTENPITEIILGLSPTMEGDTTAFYLTKRIKPFGVKITTIARGIPIGGDLEYADEITLGRSIVSRIAYE
ncbi:MULTISPECIES: recombination mediator RecR [Flectobacillus]|uniref:Recombination protein RecR n=1 Tax=Flectobacillus roseus TaxID=502259 RepID=A0ABT6Y4H3_9BACT|nr:MULTISPECIES: recombination mediator RecR [Flectobacillus]MDI9858468.1 recombination mediator RecR [Flectobacillus roseus]NBA75956.1 recombination protein RecR [Emticicia sp. ODNR4P]PAC28542.1 recombination protein RecR [Flectobacillus sp. BAB-3569]